MIQEAIRRIIEYKTLFGLHPLIATDGEIERETGVNRAEIARISQEVTKDGRMYHGRTISGKYYGLTKELNSQDIMKGFQQAIKEHLDKMAAQDEAFAAKYAAKCASEEDSIASCCKYITNEVQSKYKVGSAVLTDAEVFGMAMHYYDENIAPPKSGVNCKVVMSKAELTPEDEEAIRREARAAAEQKIRDEEAARIRREQKAAEEAAAKKKEAAERKRKEWEEADLLFNFDEE